MNDLQLQDYEDGYMFGLRCRHCGHTWQAEPKILLADDAMHARMYLDEVERLLRCRRCGSDRIMLSPKLITRTHHFVGGLA